MTPGEFRALLERRIKWYENIRGDNDAIGAYHNYVIAACAGCKDVKIRDFLMFKKKSSEKPMSENDWNKTLGAWTSPKDNGVI
jgi:hypothetical protein